MMQAPALAALRAARGRRIQDRRRIKRPLHKLRHKPRDTGVPRGWQKPASSRGGVLAPWLPSPKRDDGAFFRPAEAREGKYGRLRRLLPCHGARS